ncbi:MAG: hypothetical protein AB1673_13465 [Actinomycetota bacterium]|jgi:hypothetical protein
MTTTRYPIRFHPFHAVLMGALGMGRRVSWVEVTDDRVEVRMGIGFRATVPRASIVGAARHGRVWTAWGVHGWSGHWIVNGSGLGVVEVRIDPRARARVLGVKVTLRKLWVSLDDPDGFLAAIGHPPHGAGNNGP